VSYTFINVRTKDEYRSPGTPRFIEFEGSLLGVAEIEKHWHEAYKEASWYPMEYFRIRTDDNRRFVLRYCTLFRSWGIRALEEVV